MRNGSVSAISGSRTSACRPCADRLGDRLEIDLGLARAGDAVEQEGRERAGVDRGAKLGRGLGLGRLERGRIVVRIGHGEGVVDRDLDRLDRARP